MKKILFSVAAIPFTSLLLFGQAGASGSQSWVGLLVDAGCRARPGDGSTAKSGAEDLGAPRKTNAATRAQNTTYEQAQNQVDQPRNAASTHDSMARTTDRGTPVDRDDSLARTTTPAVDDEGTRGKATINNTAANDAANRAAQMHGSDQSASGVVSSNTADMAKAADASCRIGQKTNAFALLTDGSMAKFDDASNYKIVQQLRSGDRVQHKTKIFRAKVKGSMQNGAISADSIQM